ncbi:MAG: hypothetical protein BVN32_12480 [Proteobacteria bacterium ST_bin14]|nr:MAG: hypothetical protein BVN32_12480 [Proteobacteria bacterium ST_bin14]
MMLTPVLAARFANIALGHVGQEYPHKLDHVLSGPGDAQTPRALHPIFFGSFDWHSCVHGYWLLMRLRRLFPDLPEVTRIEAVFDDMLTLANVAVEVAYLDRSTSAGFERPYGWAWMLALHGEAAGTRWGSILEPLAVAFAARFRAFLPKQTYPIRTGTHFNTAFALILALEWAQVHDEELAAIICDRALSYFGTDRDCPAWEPGGDEFLSSALTEALCMKRVMRPDAFRIWVDAFLPGLHLDKPATLFTPAFVSDRSDGKIAHLDGCNFSRAWCFRELATVFNAADASRLHNVAAAHVQASLPYVAGDFMGEHWLATFAVLALESPNII